MANFKDITITEEFFGKFYPYVLNDEITDVDYDGRNVWIQDCSSNIYKADVQLTSEDIAIFTQNVQDATNVKFNRKDTLLEADTDTLRISILHESNARSGRSICIRKTLPIVRIEPVQAIMSNYATREMLEFLINGVLGKMTFVICGEPGVGKTELAKMLSTYIKANQKVITIEDTPEWRYTKINPDKAGVELVMNEDFDYSAAIKACMRMNPKWMMVSEVRGKEVKELITGWSTGVSGMTTIHTDDVTLIPDRILDMMETRVDAERLENDVYNYVDIGVLIVKKEINGELVRMIDQICYFTRENRENRCYKLFTNGEKVKNELQKSMLKDFEKSGIQNPFQCDILREELYRAKKKQGMLK